MTSTEKTMTESLAQSNRKYWDTASQNVFKDKWVADLQQQIAEFLLDPVNFGWLGLPSSSGHDTKMLDYACGNGLPSRTLKPHFASCIGIDVSAGMLEKYNATARELGLGPHEMMGVRGDLFAEPIAPTEPILPEERLQDFDMIAICMALHHMDDVQSAISKLAARLRRGGTLLVIDWARIDGSTPAQQDFIGGLEERELKQDPDSYHDPHHPHEPHPASHTISHDSFTEQQVTELFLKGGCGEVRWKLAETLSDVPGARLGKMQLFWARATKQ